VQPTSLTTTPLVEAVPEEEEVVPEFPRKAYRN
jgi:hypothetical protein